MLAPLRDLFAAVFFVFFGLQTDPDGAPAGAARRRPRLALSPRPRARWRPDGGRPARRGIDLPGRVRAGATLIAHGEFSIVIAGLAVAGGQPAKLGALAASYVLLLAIVGPLAAGQPMRLRLAVARRPADRAG